MDPRTEHYRKLEKMYLGAPCNDYFRPTMHIAEGEASVTIAIEPHLHHAAGAAHGTVYFKVADDAAYFAAQSLVEDLFLLTYNLNLHMLKPLREGSITARGKVVFQSRALIMAESALADAQGREVGRATATLAKSKIPLDTETGYKL